MKISIKELLMVLVALVICLPALTSYASEEQYILGVINRDDGRTLIVNESIILKITEQTRVYNSRGKEISKHSLRGHKWIYAEGFEREDGSIRAQSIFLLPGYIDEKSKGRYPFIKSH